MTQTKAEIRARQLAARFEQAGFTTEVTVDEHEARLFTNGGTLLPARTTVHVRVDPAQSWDDSYSFSFITWHRSERHRESTLYAGGHIYRRIRTPRQKYGSKLSLKALGLRLACELDNARYRKQRESQEV
jgi:hypothetical protein